MKTIHTTIPGILGLALALSITLSGCCCNPPETVDFVDVEKYMGKWYEIAKYPVIFERGLVGVTAEYTLLDDGKVRVVNQGFRRDFDGDLSLIEGTAKVANRVTNAKLTVQFGPIPFSLFGSNYWIIGLDEDYEYAVVSDRCRNTLWILSRTPQMDSQVYDEIVFWLAQNGFDTDRLELMPQPE